KENGAVYLYVHPLVRLAADRIVAQNGAFLSHAAHRVLLRLLGEELRLPPGHHQMKSLRQGVPLNSAAQRIVDGGDVRGWNGEEAVVAEYKPERHQRNPDSQEGGAPKPRTD